VTVTQITAVDVRMIVAYWCSLMLDSMIVVLLHQHQYVGGTRVASECQQADIFICRLLASTIDYNRQQAKVKQGNASIKRVQVATTPRSLEQQTSFTNSARCKCIRQVAALVQTAAYDRLEFPNC